MCQPTSLINSSKELNGNSQEKNNKSSTNGDELVLARRTLDRGTLLACVSLLLLITGMSITFPQMQSRRDELGCDSLCYGSMTSVRSALGLVGTAVVGRLSDKNGSLLARTLGSLGTMMSVDGITSNNNPSGRRACLYLGTMATLIGLAIAVSMNSLIGLWLSMIPGALLQHNFDVYKAFLSEYHNDVEYLEKQTNEEGDAEMTDKSDKQASASSRAGSIGKLGMAAGISFMIGPTMAAMLSPTFQTAAYFAIVCTLVSGLVIFQLPLPVASAKQHNYKDASNEEEQALDKKTEFTLMNMLRLKTPKSRAAMTLLVIRLSMALAFHIFNTIWPASLKARFNFGPTDHARFMSFIGITYAFSQGLLAKRLVQMWGKDGKVYLLMACCAVLGAGRYIAYSTNSLAVIYSAFFFIINALGTMNTVITADTGSIAPSDEIGSLFGILQSAENAAGMLGPFLGGVIAHYLGKDAPLVAVVGVYGLLFAFVSWGYERYVVSSSSDLGKKEEKKSI